MSAAISWSLQKAIYETLVGAAPLVALLGGAKVYDMAPRTADHPYVTIGTTAARDWSTGTETGTEHIVTLHVWSAQPGRKEVHDVLKEIEIALTDFTPVISGHRLVHMHRLNVEVRKVDQRILNHGTIRFRAVTEVV